MRTLGRLTLCSLLVLILVAPVSAGQLAEDLRTQIASAPSDQKLTVWITLPSERPRSTVKAAAEGSTRLERYQSALDQLRQNNTMGQDELVAALEQLQVVGQATNIKRHWLVNVVEVEIAAGAIAAFSQRDDIEMIYPSPRLVSIIPEKSDATATLAAGVSENLQFINADAAWAAGYTGAGRLVCSFDTGVEGDHPALSPRWKGNDGDFAAAWFDPRYDGQAFPRVITNCDLQTCNPSHGTHTMGIMVGRDDATGDTTGVAPEAQWMSAAVIDLAGTSIIDAFEWAANPDGDPNSIDDVPDVINHSWGVFDVGCQDLFYDMIEATEALGIVNVFAAGNEGSGSGSIRNPANRALDSIDCFAVGNVDARGATPTVYSSSSRGPSDCNGAIKPNVCAPGASIRSTWPGDGYNSLTGTSMAAPQVSGLVALLRQKNPNATVAQIKTAILTTARDFGYNLPDNDYGWGIIDCMAALNAIPANPADPNVRLYSFDHPPIAPGDTVRATVLLQNIGDDVSSVSATLSGSDPLLTVISGNLGFGSMVKNDTVRSDSDVEVVVAGEALEGSVLSLDLDISGAGGYVATRKLYFLVEPVLERAVATHDVGLITFSLTNFGTFGLGDGQWFPAGGEGFIFDASDDYLYEGGLIVGTDAQHVSDGVRNASGEPDGDFGVLPGGNITVANPGPGGSQMMMARFGDQRAENPLGLEITQLSYAYPTAPNNDFIILKYIISNPQAFSINGVYFGIYLDWDVISYQLNAGGFNLFDEYCWTAYYSAGNYSSPRGCMLLEGPLATGWTNPGTLVSYDGDGFTEAEKFAALTHGTSSAGWYDSSGADLIQLVAAGPLDFASGDIDTVAFALLAANSLTGMTDASDRARTKYGDILTAVDDDQPGRLPDGFALHQNYPNPFNPSTTISFVLPRKSDYRLNIFNIAGQRVTEIDGRGSVGANHVEWNAEGHASGVYLYKLTAGDYSASRKMLLLR